MWSFKCGSTFRTIACPCLVYAADVRRCVAGVRDSWTRSRHTDNIFPWLDDRDGICCRSNLHKCIQGKVDIRAGIYMTVPGICYCLEISLNGTKVAMNFFGVLDVRGVTPNRGEGVQCLSASDLESGVRRQSAGKGVFWSCGPRLFFRTKTKRAYPAKMPSKPFIYVVPRAGVEPARPKDEGF